MGSSRRTKFAPLVMKLRGFIIDQKYICILPESDEKNYLELNFQKNNIDHEEVIRIIMDFFIKNNFESIDEDTNSLVFRRKDGHWKVGIIIKPYLCINTIDFNLKYLLLYKGGEGGFFLRIVYM